MTGSFFSAIASRKLLFDASSQSHGHTCTKTPDNRVRSSKLSFCNSVYESAAHSQRPVSDEDSHFCVPDRNHSCSRQGSRQSPRSRAMGMVHKEKCLLRVLLSKHNVCRYKYFLALRFLFYLLPPKRTSSLCFLRFYLFFLSACMRKDGPCGLQNR